MFTALPSLLCLWPSGDSRLKQVEEKRNKTELKSILTSNYHVPGSSISLSLSLSLQFFFQVLEPGQRLLPREGFSAFFWRMSRIGERLSPYVGFGCAIMVIHVLFLK
jgi:hypothetical protein